MGNLQQIFLRELLAELREFGAPLTKAAASPAELQRLLVSLGWSFEGLLHAELDPALQIVRDTLDDLVALAEGLVPAPPANLLPDLPELSPSPQVLAAAAQAAARAAAVRVASTATDALERAAAGLGVAAQKLQEAAVKIVTAAVPTTTDAAGQQTQAGAKAAAALGADLLDFLIRDWLRRRWPVGLALCTVTGLVSEEEQAEIKLQIGARSAVVRSALKRPCTRIVQLPQLAGSLLGQALSRASALHDDPREAAASTGIDVAGAVRAGTQDLLAALPADPLATLRHDLERLELTLRAMGVEEPRLEITPQQLSLIGVLPGPPGEPLLIPLTLGGVTLTVAGSTSGSTGTWSVSWTLPAVAPSALGLQLPAPFGLQLAMTGALPGALPKVTLQRDHGRLGCTLTGGLLVKLPADLLTAAGDDAQVSGSASATLTLALGADPKLTLETVQFSARDVRLGGKSGLLVSGAVTLENLCFPWSDTNLPKLTVVGACQLAGASGSASVAFKAILGEEGFSLESTGALKLEGVRLRPLPPPAATPTAPDLPVLKLTVARGLGAAAKLDVAVNGAVDLPVASGLSADPTRGVALGLGGSLSAQVSAEGVSLLSVSASGGLLTGSVVALPGGLLLEALAAKLSWSAPSGTAAAAELVVGLTGEVRAGANAPGAVHGSAAFSGAVHWNGAKSQPAGEPALSGTVTLDGVSFTKDLVVVKAALGLEVSPASCRLTLAGGQFGLLAKQAAPKVEADFHLFAKEVGGACNVAADGSFSLGLSGTAVLPAALGGGTAPTATLDAVVIGKVNPFSLKLASGTPDPQRPGRSGARLSIDALSLGGAKVKPATLTVEGVELPLKPTSEVRLTLDGTLLFPGAGNVVVDGDLSVVGSPPTLLAHLTCKAGLVLPGGLSLLPVDDVRHGKPPTLEASISLGGQAASSASFTLNARLLLPQDGVSKEADLLDGTLELGEENGAPVLKLLHATTESGNDSTWTLPGGLELKEFGAELKLETVGAVPSGLVTLWGKLKDPRLTGGKADFTGIARGGGAGFAASGHLTIDDVTFAELCLAHAELDVAVTSAPTCTLILKKGLVGFKPKSTPATPKTAADFELAFDDLAAELDVTSTQTSAALSGSLLLPDGFSSSDGRGRITLGTASGSPASGTTSAGPPPPEPGASLVLKRKVLPGSGAASLELRSALLDLANLRLGGKDGLLLKSGHLSLKNFALPPEAATEPWAVAVDGAIDFPGGSEVALSGAFKATEFKLTSKLDLKLGGGFVIHAPPGGGDTLELDVTTQGGAGSEQAKIHFALAGGIDFPGTLIGQDGGDGAGQGRPATGVIPPTQRIDLKGSVDFTASPSGVTLQKFQAKSSSPSTWRLPGGLVLSQLSAEVAHSPQETLLSARGRIELGSFVTAAQDGSQDGVTIALGVKRTGDNLHLHGELADLHLTVASHLRIFGGSFTADVDTSPVKAQLTVAGATAGLLLKEGCSGAVIADYHFAVEGLTGSLELSRGFTLRLTQGTLHLPSAYLPSSGAGVTLPQVSIGDLPLTLSFDEQTRKLGLDGSLVLTDGAIAAGSGDAPRATLAHARLVFAGQLPLGTGVAAGDLTAYAHLDGVSGTVHLPLPNGEGVDLEFRDGTWDANGFPLGTVGVKNDIKIKFGGGSGTDDSNAFVLIFPGQQQGATAFRNEVTIAARPGEGGYHDFTIHGAVGLQVPLSLISNSDPAQKGSNLYAEAEGSIDFSDAPNSEVRLHVNHLEFGGTFRLGSDDGGLVIQDARLVADNVDRLFARSVDAANPFTLTLTGKIGVDFSGKSGPSLGVKDARFSFKTLDLTSLKALPEFEIKQFEFDQGEALAELPISIRDATFTFKDPKLPLYAASGLRLLDPDNIEIGCSLGLKLPLGDGAGAMARADGVKASIENGMIRLSVSGVGFGVDDLTVGPVGVSGALYVGGLDSDPFRPFFAGKLGGEVDGTGLDVLLACEVDKPLGMSLAVEGGAAGIPIGPTGFLITGASGGISFLNTPIDPSDLSKYITINQPVDATSAPAAPARTSNSFPEEPPPPDPSKQQGPAADGKTPPGGATPADGKTPPGGASTGRRSLPTVRPDQLANDGCPGNCPPSSVDILCQPHPDQTLYPGRVIYKFSALDESFLLRFFPTEMVQRLKGVKQPDASTVDEIANLVDRGLRELSGFDRIPAQPEQLRKAANDGLLLARSAFTTALKKAFLAYPAQDAWAVLRATAWAGVPCQDQTLQVTGQVSYAGVSAVATIEGGVSISTTGNAGVIGNLNLLGMKVGKLRGFITVTDEQGAPDPSLCADLEVVMGPINLGHVKFLYRYGINVGKLAKALVAELAPYADKLFRPLLLEVVAPAMRAGLGMPKDGKGDFDAAQVLNLLAARAADAASSKGGGLQQILVLVERVMSGGFIALKKNPNSSPKELAKLVYRLVDVVWASYQPEIKFCAVGEVTIFGFALPGNVEIQGNAGKDHFFVKLSCSNGIITTQISCYFTFPNFYSLLIETVGMLLAVDDPHELPTEIEKIAATLATRTAAQMAHNAVIVASVTLAPLGFTLGQAVVRVLLPNLANYPAASWLPPTTPSGIPTRVEVLTAALRDGALAKGHWRGMPDEMATLHLPEGKSAAGTHLIDTFFPHGGLIGAGFLMVPSFFTEPPPVEDFLTVLDSSKGLGPRGAAAMKVVEKLTGGMVNLGSLSLYLPPPALPTELFNEVKEHPEKFLEALRGLKFPSGPEPLLQLFNQSMGTFKLCFFKGHLKGRLFGIDFLKADAEFVPAGAPDAEAPPAAGPGQHAAKADPHAKAHPHAEPGPRASPDPHFMPGPLGRLEGMKDHRLGKPPPATGKPAPAGPPQESILTITVHGTTKEGVIGQLLPLDAQLEIVVRGQQPQPLEKTFHEFKDQLDRALHGQPHASVLAGLLASLKSRLATDLPKASLRTLVDVELTLPPSLRPYLTLERHVRLYGYTPGFSATEDATVEGRAKHRGGIGFHGDLKLGFCGLVCGGALDLEIEVDKQDQPRVRGQLAMAMSAPGTFREITATFDSNPEHGADWVMLSGSVSFGSFQIGPWKAEVLGVQTEIFPARDIPGGTRCSFVLHAGPGGVAGSFDASVSLDGNQLQFANLSFDVGPAAGANSTVNEAEAAAKRARLLESMTQALSKRLVAKVKEDVEKEVQRLTQAAVEVAATVHKALDEAKAAAEGLRQQLDQLTPIANQAVTDLTTAKAAADAAFNDAVSHIPGYQR